MLPEFFYSKKYKIIVTTIFVIELLVIIFAKIYGMFCIEEGCWNRKAWGTEYCEEHINIIYENYKKNHPNTSNKKRKNYNNSYSGNSNRSYSSGKKRDTPSYSSNTYNSNAYSTNRRDSYDVYNYDDPDDFADDWAEEFGDGDYDGGYDDAYDYWEENYGN